ncbi:unnamed protein product [Caenorhabditis auriculariae]|uniref:Uncharacterized protein n=1 Tax=Caenorhabditis auriculariae TaxID=2777116 RepID=A0A8S1GR79_9PELO|nr:unnamed protein product [Caenorhabditis auriculariae]
MMSFAARHAPKSLLKCSRESPLKKFGLSFEKTPSTEILVDVAGPSETSTENYTCAIRSPSSEVLAAELVGIDFAASIVREEEKVETSTPLARTMTNNEIIQVMIHFLIPQHNRGNSVASSPFLTSSSNDSVDDYDDEFFSEFVRMRTKKLERGGLSHITLPSWAATGEGRWTGGQEPQHGFPQSSEQLRQRDTTKQRWLGPCPSTTLV